MIGRQKRTGWTLIVVSAAFIAYFLKVRLLTAGPLVEKREWLQFAGMIVILIIGIVNVRLAARRAQAAHQARRVSQ